MVALGYMRTSGALIKLGIRSPITEILGTVEKSLKTYSKVTNQAIRLRCLIGVLLVRTHTEDAFSYGVALMHFTKRYQSI